jgi:hypothetical protein
MGSLIKRPVVRRDARHGRFNGKSQVLSKRIKFVASRINRFARSRELLPATPQE